MSSEQASPLPRPSSTGTITLEHEWPHPPEKVWRALTDPELLAQWLLPVAGFRLEEGASFTFQAPSQPGWDGVVRCRMLEVEPQRRLSFTWVVGDMELDTVVTFMLTPTESGTRLTILHSGFGAGQKQAMGGARYGWNLMGGRLADLLPRIA